MKKRTRLRYEFVEFIPDTLEEDTLYVSIAFATAVHKCCCGCGSEVTTPISPTDWQLIFDGRSVSLQPSIGNWSLTCRSHYWIRRDEVVWAPAWSKEQIDSGRIQDHRAKREYFDSLANPEGANRASNTRTLPERVRWLTRLKKWFKK